MKNIFTILRRLEVYVNGDSNLDRKKLFLRLKTFALSGSYTSYGRFAEFVDLSFKKAREDSYVASKMGISEQAVRLVKHRITKDLMSVVGEDVFRVIEFGESVELKRALRDFKYLEKDIKSTTLFSADLLSAISDCTLEEKDFSISDCKYEMTLLHWLSSEKMKDLISKVDADRLSFLLKVIDGKEGSPQDRINVLKVLFADDLLKHSKPEDYDKYTFPPCRPDDEF